MFVWGVLHFRDHFVQQLLKAIFFLYFIIFEYFFCTQTVSVGSTSVERYNPAALKAIRLMKVENIVIVEQDLLYFSSR